MERGSPEGSETGEGFGTVAVHGRWRADRGRASPEGREGGRGRPERVDPSPHVPPIHQTTAFVFPDLETGSRTFAGEEDRYIYSRAGNPTVRTLERRIAALETHPDSPEEIECRVFASGLASLGAVARGATAAGGRIVCQEGIYGSTVRQMTRLRRHGVRVDFVPPGDVEALATALEKGPPPDLVHVETPANPLLQLTELEGAAEAAHGAGALLSVDATFATPILLQPLRWGADFSIHSTTKWIAGHGVVLGGAVTGRREVIEEHVEPERTYGGGSPDPFGAWLTLLGLPTLPLRVERASASAAILADVLAEHEAVERVYYPDPSALPEGQLAGGGPMISLDVAGGTEGARRTADALRIATIASSLGTPDTLVQHPDSMSHSVVPEEERRAMGIGPGLLRVSVGLEDPDDLVADFRSALGAATE